MQTNQTVSIQKIIGFVVFVSTALIASLFVYHMSHQQLKPTLSPDSGFIFPEARDIKSFSLTTENNKPFTEKDLYKHWTLMFFGFTHCSSVCPTTMTMMNKAYEKLSAAYPNLQIVLVSLDPERDTQETLAAYAHSFNSSFIGVSGKIQDLRKLQSQLGIYSERDTTNATDKNYQLQHTSSILLINPHGQWAGLFKFGMSPDAFAQAFKDAVTPELSIRG